MSLSRNKTNNVYPCKPQFYYIKVGFKGVKIIYICFRDELNFLKHRYFYILVCMFTVDTDQPAQLHSLISLHHTMIYCFFVQIAQTDQAAGMRRQISLH